jgi:phosphoribosylpyrophosphate synthetase
MERVEKVGEVATAATLARILSVMPHTASGPTQMVFLDIHALSEQFYFTDDVLVHLKSCIHLLKIRLARLQNTSSCPVVVVFPDDGACKRFGSRFKGFELVVCHKVRDGDKRKVCASCMWKCVCANVQYIVVCNHSIVLRS